jgi:hypothetical protein
VGSEATINLAAQSIQAVIARWMKSTFGSERNFVGFLLQLLTDGVLLLGAIVSGALTHFPGEQARRTAFMETRQCIEARLRTLHENQRQVSKSASNVSEHSGAARRWEKTLVSDINNQRIMI